MKAKIWISFLVSFLISILLYLIRNYFSAPLLLFNIAGYLKLPGDFIVYILFGFVNPNKAWQILHGGYPYSLIAYFICFLFYFFVVFIVIKYFKFKRG